MAEVTLSTPRGEMKAWTATPLGNASWPGVVVIHDAFGMTKALREAVEWMAKEEFLPIAPDLFRGQRSIKCMREAMKQVAARRGPCFDDVEAARSWLTANSSCTGKVGVIGFCMGGGFAIALAPMKKYRAASVNYGHVPRDAETYLDGACPIVASYGGLDRGLKGAAARLERLLSTMGVPHDVKEYPDCGHSFLEDHDPKELPFLFVLLKGLFHAGYHAPSALDARQRIVAFFNTHLRTAAP